MMKVKTTRRNEGTNKTRNSRRETKWDEGGCDENINIVEMDRFSRFKGRLLSVMSQATEKTTKTTTKTRRLIMIMTTFFVFEFSVFRDD